jgi:hypothetical protein
MALDPFDPAALRLPQNFAPSAKKLLTTIPVRKPGKQDFIRVCPNPDYRLSPAGIIELKEEGETYLVMPQMVEALVNEFAYADIFLTINRQGVLALWPVKLPGERANEWHRSAAEAAERAMREWIRISANMSLGAYEMVAATVAVPEPEWPEISFTEILRIAFRDRAISSPDHPVVRRLRGAA